MNKTYNKKYFPCQFCGGTEAERINSYKSYWISCNNCGNIKRILKDRFPLEFLPKWIFGSLSKRDKIKPISIRGKLRYALFRNGTDTFYDYYLEESQKVMGGFSLSSKGTKWEGESEYVLKELQDWNINIKDKKVLEISGGPGYFAKELQQNCKRWTVSELSELSVNRMKNKLNLDAIKFDINSDDISNLVDDTFDIIFMRHCINFCLDIKKFLKSLKKIIHKDTVIYVSFSQPTLASCMRWSLDDYTFLVLYNPETVQKLFAEEGFIAFGKREQGTRHWIFGGYWQTKNINWGHVAASPMKIPYYIINKFKNINTSSREKNLAMIFNKNSSTW